MKKIFILHGPNLQFLGVRPKALYGDLTYQSICHTIRESAARLQLEVSFFQSNHEGHLIDFLQSARGQFDGGIVNLGGYSHTSVALRDAIEIFGGPVMEVHLTDVKKREWFRRKLITATACLETVAGLGVQGYVRAMELLRKTIEPWAISAFYKFYALNDDTIQRWKTELEQWGTLHRLRGLIILAPEGVNATVAGQGDTISRFKDEVISRFGDTIFKDSSSEDQPFRRWKVVRREEIITSESRGLKPPPRNGHLSPREWNEMIRSRSDVILLDTRNEYESRVGTFENAICPPIESFSEFPEFVRRKEISKTAPILMFCTGGIRCEKAALEMQAQGYENVYQLEGGILRYLQEYPDEKFKGECYVFDHRVAVDQKLQPSTRFFLCPHCGDPGDIELTCKRCDRPTHLCVSCATQFPQGETCSKNCANLWNRDPGHKGKPQIIEFDRP